MTGDEPQRCDSVDVVCAGEPYAMGVTQGEALRESIHAALASLRQLEPFRMSQPRWLPYRLYRWLVARRALRVLGPPLRRDFAAMNQRLEGIADGARMTAGAVYLMNALEAVLSSVHDRAAVPCPGACSAIAVRGTRSRTGEPIIARNFDYLPLVQPFYCLRDSRPRGGHRSFDFTVAPIAGAIDGMNEHGLTVTYNYAYTIDAALPSAPISMAVAEALARATTVTEAAEWIRSRPRWGGGLLMMADAEGDIAALELSSTRSQLRRPEPGEDLLFHTNALACAELREVEAPAGMVFNERAPMALRGRRVLASAEQRDERLRALLGSAGPLDADDLAAVLADHGPENIPGDHTVCTHGSYWETTASLQFFPRSRRVRAAFAPACRARHKVFQL